MTTTVAPPGRQQLLDSIRGIGHWRVRIIPESAEQRFARPVDCRDAVANNAVGLRGWDYPHVPVGNVEFERSAALQDGWEAMIDRTHHRELWRLMRSGQFIHYRALWEDARPEYSERRILDVTTTVYTLFEVVEFCRRLTGVGRYGTAIELDIDLDDVEGRRLVMLNSMRMLGRSFRTADERIQLRRSIPLPLIESEARTTARDLAIELFDTFGCQISPRIIDGIQEELSPRR